VIPKNTPIVYASAKLYHTAFLDYRKETLIHIKMEFQEQELVVLKNHIDDINMFRIYKVIGKNDDGTVNLTVISEQPKTTHGEGKHETSLGRVFKNIEQENLESYI